MGEGFAYACWNRLAHPWADPKRRYFWAWDQLQRYSKRRTESEEV